MNDIELASLRPGDVVWICWNAVSGAGAEECSVDPYYMQPSYRGDGTLSGSIGVLLRSYSVHLTVLPTNMFWSRTEAERELALRAMAGQSS